MVDAPRSVEELPDLDPGLRISPPTGLGGIWSTSPWVRTVLSFSTVAAVYRLQRCSRSRPRGTGRHAGAVSAAGRAKRALNATVKTGRKALAAASVVMPAKRSSAARWSWRVAHNPSIRPLACGLKAIEGRDAQRRHHLRGLLVALELLGEGPRGVIASEDPVAVHVERHGDPAGPDEHAQQAEVAYRILRGDEDGARQEGPRSIVHGPDQTAARPPGPQPGMRAPVPQHELAGLGLPVPAGAGAGDGPPRRRAGVGGRWPDSR